MTIEETNIVFNTITSNGCREMDEVRFHQAVNEVLSGYIENERDDFNWVVNECKIMEPKAFELVEGFAHSSVSRATLFAALVDYAKASQREA